MRSRIPACAILRAAMLATVLLAAAGCLHAEVETSIPPLPAGEDRVNPGLGPETKPLSFGPGEKGSPSWSPRGDRIAFIVDDYAVDKPAGTRDLRRRTTMDFVAEDVEWTGDGGLTILGDAGAVQRETSTVYRARPEGESPGIEEIATDVLAITPIADGDGMISAHKTGQGESGISLISDGQIERVYTGVIEGIVTGLSPSPDGSRVVLAVRPPGYRGASELRVFGLRDGEDRTIARLDGGTEILGAPQWTSKGIYFVAGGESPAREGGEPLYDLYRAGPKPGAPEPAPEVGADFVAGSIRVSPDGGRLAVVGRLTPESPANLYVIDLATERLRAVTTNEDMEIKAGPDDTAWSPDGSSVAIVARGAFTGKPEVRTAPAGDLLDDFYNLYEIPVQGLETSR